MSSGRGADFTAHSVLETARRSRPAIRAYLGGDVALVRSDYLDLDTFTAEHGATEILLGDERYRLDQVAELARCLTAAVEAARA